MIPERLRYDVFARTVTEVDSKPSTTDEISVLLEVLGCVKRDYSHPGEFTEIARRVQQLAPFYSTTQAETGTEIDRNGDRRGLRTFAEGMVFSALWSIMLIALFLGGISLWAAFPGKTGAVSPLVATSISIGVVISFVATGGVQQVFSFRMSYYRLQDNFPLVRKEAIRGYWIGFLSIMIAAGIFVITAVTTTASPLALTASTVIFLILLGGYRILVIPLYAYRRLFLVAIGLFIALIALYSSYYFLSRASIMSVGYEILISQVFGLAVLDIITAIECSYALLRQRDLSRELQVSLFYDDMSPLRNVRAPRLSLVFFEMLPLFIFGTMFYVFLFFDRLAPWISVVQFSQIYNIHYQFGADLALLVLIPLTGVTYYFLQGLFDLMRANSSATNIVDRTGLKTALGRRLAGMFVCTGIVAGVSIFTLWQYADLIIQAANGGSESVLVFRLSLVAYSLFAFFLANTSINFSFRRYSVPVVLLLVGTLTEVGANLWFPGLVAWWNPVYGLLLSVILVTVASSVNTLRFVMHAHYFYYSSF